MEKYKQLEEDFASWMNVIHTVSCSSGTAALHLALESFCLPVCSKILIPELTMIACARAAMLADLMPVFIDCDDKLLIDVDRVEEALKKDKAGKIKAIMPVHVYGRRCNMDAIAKLAVEYDLKVIEDLAEAHGILPHTGTDAACWSFYRNKIIFGEEGGMIAFRDAEAAERARSLRCLGFTEHHDFRHIPRGCNYRMSNVHAELVLKSLCKFESNLNDRRWIESEYDRFCPPEWKMPARDVPWVYDIRIPEMTAEECDAVIRCLNADGISARHCFKPMSWQEEFRDTIVDVKLLPWKAATAAIQVVYLPIIPKETTTEKIAKSFEVIRCTLSKCKNAEPLGKGKEKELLR